MTAHPKFSHFTPRSSGPDGLFHYGFIFSSVFRVEVLSTFNFLVFQYCFCIYCAILLAEFWNIFYWLSLEYIFGYKSRAKCTAKVPNPVTITFMFKSQLDWLNKIILPFKRMISELLEI